MPQKEGSSGIVITKFHMLQKSLYHSSLAFENYLEICFPFSQQPNTVKDTKRKIKRSAS